MITIFVSLCSIKSKIEARNLEIKTMIEIELSFANYCLFLQYAVLRKSLKFSRIKFSQVRIHIKWLLKVLE